MLGHFMEQIWMRIIFNGFCSIILYLTQNTAAGVGSHEMGGNSLKNLFDYIAKWANARF